MRSARAALARGKAQALAGAAILLVLNALATPGVAAEELPGTLPAPLVYLSDIDRSILQDIRYAGPDNFTGRPVPGYGAAECVLLREAAEALSRVQQALLVRELSLKVYDCYRPRSAVRAFVAWVNERETTPADPLLKRFHPNIERSRLLTDGYVAAVSHHSRGDTVDLTLVQLPARPTAPFDGSAAYGPCTGPAKGRAPDNGVDMGTGYDCFDAREPHRQRRPHGGAGALAPDPGRGHGARRLPQLPQGVVALHAGDGACAARLQRADRAAAVATSAAQNPLSPLAGRGSPLSTSGSPRPPSSDRLQPWPGRWRASPGGGWGRS